MTGPSPHGQRELAVVPLARGHLDQVCAIERVSFPQPWSFRLFLAELHNKQAMPLAAVTQPLGKVAGYLIVWLAADEAQVQNIAVHPGLRRLGVGRALLRNGLALAWEKGSRLATLEVRPSNTGARRLYASLGFREQGIRPNYYRDQGEDAILMGMNLEDLFHLSGPAPVGHRL